MPINIQLDSNLFSYTQFSAVHHAAGAGCKFRKISSRPESMVKFNPKNASVCAVLQFDAARLVFCAVR